MKIGILTSGGDCPGLNAVIRGAVLKGIAVHGQEFVGFLDGWRGVVEGDVIDIPRTMVRGIAKQGGTILGTSRTNPFENGGGPEVIKAHMDRLGIDAIIAIGGEGTLAAAKRLTDAGLKIVGVPKTVDNDLDATDYTFGFDTAVQIATEAIDRLRTTGESHHRCMIAEVMGRHVGWIALHAGMASGAHAILIPEQKASIEQITEWVDGSPRPRPRTAGGGGRRLRSRRHMEAPHSERGLDTFGRPRLGGIADQLAPELEARTGIETRATILGHIQRGGVPSAFDRVLATRLGMAAIDSVVEGRWGTMVCPQGHGHRPRRLRGGPGQAEDRPAAPLRRGRGPLRLSTPRRKGMSRVGPPLSGTMEGMTLTTFALIRHGQTDWNAQRRLQGASDIPLNDVGRGQARDAVAVLSGQEWDTIVSSPLSRAAETAELIAAGLGLTVARHVPELTERSFGPAEGLQAGPELEALRIPGGFRGAESDDEAGSRGLAALESLAEEFRGRRVLVVAHGTLLRLALSRAIGSTLQSIDNAALNLAHHHAVDGWELEYFNGERVAAAAHS